MTSDEADTGIRPRRAPASLGSGSDQPDASSPTTSSPSTMDTNDEWIRERVGIAERRIADEGESVVDMAAEPAAKALAEARG